MKKISEIEIITNKNKENRVEDILKSMCIKTKQKIINQSFYIR